MVVGCVEELAGLVGVSGRQGGEFDWPAVEESVGLSLPADYKALVETFPDGRFQGFVRPVRPEINDDGELEYLGYYAHRLEDMRRWRRDEPERFPLPIFPEPGELLPWAVTHRADLFFWLTEGNDPNVWPTVITDHEFSFWQRFAGTGCELLTDVVSGRFDASRFEIDLSSREPWFKPTPSKESMATAPPPELFWLDAYRWDQKFGGSANPVNEFAALAEILGRAPVEVEPVDWAAAEGQLGAPLPSDYKAFIDTYGPGTFGDQRIAAPGAGGEFDLFGLIERKRTQPERRYERAPFYPEPGGILVWGETLDGWGCFWAAIDPDPQQWGTVILRADYAGSEIRWDLSFSSFLLKYWRLLTNQDQFGLFTGREYERVPPSFTPASTRR